MVKNQSIMMALLYNTTVMLVGKKKIEATKNWKGTTTKKEEAHPIRIRCQWL
jgi:hypothetical protein